MRECCVTFFIMNLNRTVTHFFTICSHQCCRANIRTESPPKTKDQGIHPVATESVENDKDWEEYWEQYEAELKDGGPGKETTV